MTLDDRIREVAVARVDRRHGYTMEFAPSPIQHRMEYDEEEATIRAQVADDPGLVLCSHDPRSHSLGGGIRVCFECWARMLVGGPTLRGAR